MNKPKWMTMDVWLEFCKRWTDSDGLIHCVACKDGNPENMTVDHAVARHSMGSDELSNLQPLCRVCNSKKGSRPDGYWNRQLYFDRFLNTANLRTSQDEFVYQPILEHDELFSKPISAINGKLFCIFQVVGGGKTLGMFALPFALNFVVRSHFRAQPRIDRVLIVTKDQALRSQIASELAEEPVKFGLVSEAPRIEEITSSDVLGGTCANYDIGVMCPNILWPRMSGDALEGGFRYTWTPLLDIVLNRHPLIVFDEMHYAHRAIRSVVHAARHSLVFGFTASPIDRVGDLLKDMVAVSVYSYQNAVMNDGSMKYVA